MPRLAIDDYFETALDILGGGDLDHLTLDSIVKRLGVTKGSFYHHFTSRADFVDQLVDHWQSAHGMDIVRAARSIDDPVERLGAFRDLSLLLPHAAERTLRSAGSSDERFAKAVAHVDNERRSVVRDTLAQLGLTPAMADELAYLSLATLIGLQQVDDADRQTVLPTTLARLESMLITVVQDASIPS